MNNLMSQATNCEYCGDGDGGCIFPMFGLAPHRHVGNQMIGSTQFLDQSQWPANFSPDLDEAAQAKEE